MNIVITIGAAAAVIGAIFGILYFVKSRNKETGLKKLCIAGGVGLNSVANGRILRESPFEELFIQPSAGDGGGALGAALYAYHGVIGKPRTFILEHAYWGEEYSEEVIREFFDNNNISYEYYPNDEKLLDRKRVKPLLEEAKELMAIFIASRKTARKTGPRKKTKQGR